MSMHKISKYISGLIVLTVFTAFLSCKHKPENKKLEQTPIDLVQTCEGEEYFNMALTTAYFDSVKEALLGKNFKFPDQKLFRSKILEVYGIDINSCKSDVVVLRSEVFT